METSIKPEQLRTLATHGGVKSVSIVGQGDSFWLQVTTLGGDQRLLHARTGRVRAFKRMETVLQYLKDDLGIAAASIRFDRWNPKQGSIQA